LAGVIGPFAAPACNVPVFRYALERWNPDSFVAVVFHRGPFTAEQQAVVETLEKLGAGGAANLTVAKVDVSQAMSPPFRALWQAQANQELPWMVVRYPAQTGVERPVWTGPLSMESGRALADSPARRELCRRLLKGDTAVWLLLESGDKTQNDALARTLETESRKLEQTLELPKPAADDPQLNMDLPLRVAFSTLRVARSDPAEGRFVDQLLNWHPGLKNATNTMLFPVFGRGRVLPPAIGEKIRIEVIGAIAKLLTGPCSCQVKEMNAGSDLLMTANWEALAESRSAKPAESLPLVGMSRFADAAAASIPIAQPRAAAVLPAPAGAATAPTARNQLARNLVAVLGISVVLLAITTVVLNSRGRRSPH